MEFNIIDVGEDKGSAKIRGQKVFRRGKNGEPRMKDLLTFDPLSGPPLSGPPYMLAPIIQTRCRMIKFAQHVSTIAIVFIIPVLALACRHDDSAVVRQLSFDKKHPLPETYPTSQSLVNGEIHSADIVTFRQHLYRAAAVLDRATAERLIAWSLSHPDDPEAAIAAAISDQEWHTEFSEHDEGTRDALEGAAAKGYMPAISVVGWLEVDGTIERHDVTNGLERVRDGAKENEPIGIWMLGVLSSDNYN